MGFANSDAARSDSVMSAGTMTVNTPQGLAPIPTVPSRGGAHRAEPTVTVPAVVGVSVLGGDGVGKTTFLESVGGHAASLDLGTAHAPARAVTTELVLSEEVLLAVMASSAVDPVAAQAILHDAACAVLLVDTSRLEDSFPALDAVEAERIPYVVAVNCFGGVARYPLEDVRHALGVPVGVPVLYTDARLPSAVREVLIAALTEAIKGP